jgi:hypothetical protein
MGMNIANIQFAKVTRTTATLSIAVSGTPQVIPWEAAIVAGNPFALWSSSVNPSRVTILAPGWYSLVANVDFAASATGDREIYFVKTGANAFGRQTIKSATLANPMSTQAVLRLLVGDYIEVFANQTSGGALNVVTTSANETPSLTVTLIRPVFSNVSEVLFP